MDRLEAFETMLADLQRQDRHEKQEMERLKAAGREKSAPLPPVFRQPDDLQPDAGPVPEIWAAGLKNRRVLQGKGAAPWTSLH